MYKTKFIGIKIWKSVCPFRRSTANIAGVEVN